MKRRILGTAVVCAIVLVLTGCSHQASSGISTQFQGESQHDESAQASSVEKASAKDADSQRTYTGGWGLVSDDFIEQFVERYDEIESYAVGELEGGQTGGPIHAAIGKEIEATGNLAVSVSSVESGPYDYADNTPTVKVTVTMRNLTDKTVSVKPSNWDADNENGQRVNHKLYIKDERGKRDVRSFMPTKISPHATFTGTVYFDGEGLKSVIYEPHWLISSQSQYIYFDL